MSRLRPDPSVTLTDVPVPQLTPGEVPQLITQELAHEAIQLCRLLEMSLAQAARNPEQESLYWCLREFLTRAGARRG